MVTRVSAKRLEHRLRETHVYILPNTFFLIKHEFWNIEWTSNIFPFRISTIFCMREHICIFYSTFISIYLSVPWKTLNTKSYFYCFVCIFYAFIFYSCFRGLDPLCGLLWSPVVLRGLPWPIVDDATDNIYIYICI